MIPITTLRLLFEDGSNLAPTKLRGAVVDAVLQLKPLFGKAGISTDLFHNHNEETWLGDKAGKSPNITRYPLIQYKQQPGETVITGIGKGSEALKLWGENCGGTLHTNNSKKTITEKTITTYEWEPVLLPENRSFSIQSWLPLNSQNLEKYGNTIKLADRIKKLDSIIWGNVFRMFDDAGITLDRKKVFLYIEEIWPVKNKTCYNVEWKTFNITINTNINFPGHIGFGHGVSLGFGDLKRVAKPNQYDL